MATYRFEAFTGGTCAVVHAYPQATHWNESTLFMTLVNSSQRALGAEHFGQDGWSGAGTVGGFSIGAGRTTSTVAVRHKEPPLFRRLSQELVQCGLGVFSDNRALAGASRLAGFAFRLWAFGRLSSMASFNNYLVPPAEWILDSRFLCSLNTKYPVCTEI
jgi:hypothetical protein